MIKKILLAAIAALFIGALIFGAINRTLAKGETGSGVLETRHQWGGQTDSALHQGQSEENPAGEFGSGYGRGRTNHQPGNPVQGSGWNLSAQPGELSSDEREALEFMLEEEKLAHDLYLAFSETWGQPAFQNIAQSEQSHMEAVLRLVEYYGLADSASGQVGQFSNPDLQALYDTLLAQGKTSLDAALQAAALVEEQDILDLQQRLSNVDNADIQQVFNNLLRGSTSHLSAFTRLLQNQTGTAYQPQRLSPEAYSALMNHQGAGGYGNKQGGQGRGQGGFGNGQGGFDNGQGGFGSGQGGPGNGQGRFGSGQGGAS